MYSLARQDDRWKYDVEKEEDFSPTLSTALAGPGSDLYYKCVAGSMKYSMCFLGFRIEKYGFRKP